MQWLLGGLGCVLALIVLFLLFDIWHARRRLRRSVGLLRASMAALVDSNKKYAIEREKIPKEKVFTLDNAKDVIREVDRWPPKR